MQPSLKAAMMTFNLIFLMGMSLRAGVIQKEPKWPLDTNRRIEFFIDKSLVTRNANRCYDIGENVIREAVNRWNREAGQSICLVESAEPPQGRPYVLMVARPERTVPTSLEKVWKFFVGDDISPLEQAWRDFAGEDPSTVAEATLGFQGNKQGSNRILVKGTPQADAILHELGHVFGLVHELQHCERDQFVDLKAGFFAGDGLMEFREVCDSTKFNILGYDFASVMHYSRIIGTDRILWDPESGKEQLLMQQVPGGIEKVGNWKRLSRGDLDALRSVYGSGSVNCPSILVPTKPSRRTCPEDEAIPPPD